MTDKLIYLLLSQRNQTSSETETQTLPFTFKSNGHRLRNYRIYGNTVNGESVGDLVTEGEHAGEYCVPVTINSNPKSNLFNGTFIHRSVIGAVVGDDDPNRRSIVVDISNFNNGDKITFSRETGVGGMFQMYQVSSPLTGGELLDSNVFSGNSETITATITLKNISTYPYLMIFLNGATNPITDEELLASKIMINVGDTALPYEPYHESITVDIYLPEQIRKVDNKLEYIDFKEQMLHKIRKNLFDNSKATLTNISVSQNQIYHFVPINSGSQVLEYSLPLTEDKYYSVSFTAYATVDGTQIRLDGIPDSIYADAHIADLSINLTSQPIRYTVNHRLFLAGNEKFRLYRIPNTAYANESDIFIYDIQIEETEQCTNYDPYVGNTELYVALPALPTLSGTNTLSVGTTVQPSKVYLQGKISEAEIVSAEPVQTNMQSLQPLSLDDDDFQLDVMPIESDLQLDVMPIESDLQLDVMPVESDLQLDVIIPTANLNRIEDDEDAE